MVSTLETAVTPPTHPGQDGETWAYNVDSSTLQVIANIFPLPTLGQIFFQRFLERAALEKSQLPDEGKRQVVVCTKSIAKLAEELHLSNDTTHKYVQLYKALGLLQKQKFLNNQLAFVLYTGIYHPPTTLATQLDFLITNCRPKLRDMAINVKERCLIYGLISQSVTDTLKRLSALLRIDKGDSKRLLQQRITQAQQLCSAVITHTLAALSTSSNLPAIPIQLDVQHHEQQVPSIPNAMRGRFSTKAATSNLPQVAHPVDSRQKQHTLESTSNDAIGRQLETFSMRCLPGSTNQIDGKQKEFIAESTQHTEIGRRQREVSLTDLPKVTVQGNVASGEESNESTLKRSTSRLQNGSFSTNLPEAANLVDSGQTQYAPASTQSAEIGRLQQENKAARLPERTNPVDSTGLIRNVYVNGIYNFIITYTLRTPRLVAEFLAEQLEQDRSTFPKYQKLFSLQTGQPRDPHILAAAFIGTMVQMHRGGWKMSKPGGFFTKRCYEYDAGVPEGIEECIKTYGHLSPSEFIETLTKQEIFTTPSVVAAPKMVPPASVPSLPPLKLSEEMQVDTARMVMNRDEVQHLIVSIQRNSRTALYRLRPIRLGKENPRYAVLVDASIPNISTHQTVIYSAKEWQSRLATMKTWLDLFYPSSDPREKQGG